MELFRTSNPSLASEEPNVIAVKVIRKDLFSSDKAL